MTKREQLTLMSDLRDDSFRRKQYKQWSPESDRDHCRGCWAKFSEIDSPGTLHEGNATTADYDQGGDYDWICPTCFNAFHEEMGWCLVE